LQDLVADQVQCTFSTLATAAAAMQAGQVRAIGVFAEAPVPELPRVATMRSQGIDLVVEHWWAVLAPAKTPRPILARMAEAVTRAVQAPDIAPRLEALGVTPKQESSVVLTNRIVRDLARWKEVVHSAGITP
jgi:tripartite-type tricarboxylate transporter receptor subunit TctC